jgi:hypothetical protein
MWPNWPAAGPDRRRDQSTTRPRRIRAFGRARAGLLACAEHTPPRRPSYEGVRPRGGPCSTAARVSAWPSLLMEMSPAVRLCGVFFLAPRPYEGALQIDLRRGRQRHPEPPSKLVVPPIFGPPCRPQRGRCCPQTFLILGHPDLARTTTQRLLHEVPRGLETAAQPRMGHLSRRDQALDDRTVVLIPFLD